MDDSYEAWLDQHGPTLVLLARQWLGSQHDAEDAVQEAFLRFWPQRQRVAQPAAYLYACVRTCAIELQRGRQRRERQASAGADVARAQSPFEASALGEEHLRAVEEALGGLPLEQREVLVMKIWGELTFQQIATTLGISANTAASRYRYGLSALRTALKKEALP